MLTTNSNFDEIFNSKSSVHRSTHFAVDLQIKILIISSLSTNMTPSSIYDPELAKCFIKRLAPFGILWTSFIHRPETNALVESHLKVTKNDILKSVNAKPGRVIEELRQYTLSKLIPINNEQGF